MEENYYVSEEGLRDLKNELQHLIHVERGEVIEELKSARAQGDLSENADYDAARDHQAYVEARIKELEHMIKNAELFESSSSNQIRLGSTVEIQELDTGEILTYSIVGSIEADPLNGKLSNVTPLAEAIMGKKAGTTVTVDVDEPYDVRIIKVR